MLRPAGLATPDALRAEPTLFRLRLAGNSMRKLCQLVGRGFLARTAVTGCIKRRPATGVRFEGLESRVVPDNPIYAVVGGGVYTGSGQPYTVTPAKVVR